MRGSSIEVILWSTPGRNVPRKLYSEEQLVDTLYHHAHLLAKVKVLLSGGDRGEVPVLCTPHAVSTVDRLTLLKSKPASSFGDIRGMRRETDTSVAPCELH